MERESEKSRKKKRHAQNRARGVRYRLELAQTYGTVNLPNAKGSHLNSF
jgi:hypothetical protein